MRNKSDRTILRTLCVHVEGDHYLLEEQQVGIWSDLRNPETDLFLESKPTVMLRLDICSLIEALRGTRCGKFDCIAIHIPEWPNLFVPLPNRNPLRNIAACPRALRFYFRHLLLYLLIRYAGTKIAIFDRLDACVIDARWHPFLRYCTNYFKRELPKSLLGAFLYSHKGAIEPWRSQERFGRHLNKLQPLSEGIPGEVGDIEFESVEKDIDILWGGNIAINHLRDAGLRSLHRLADLGYRVKICEGKLPKSEYYKLIQRSHLVWSPDGGGWYCLRHFEACLFHSVPIVSWPSIWQDKPFIEGVHCFYYNAEGDDLVSVVVHALRDTQKLRKMGIDGRDFVLNYHTRTGSYVRGLWKTCDPVRDEEAMGSRTTAG